MKKTIEIPEGYAARIEGNKVILEPKESEDERIRKELVYFIQKEKEYMESKVKLENSPKLIFLMDACAYLERQKEQQPKMIQWTGKNLKEVINFTGKSPRFDEWFKSWEEFETYVHQHNDILKLFREDGSHYEVPVGAWIVKTPDGYNTPSRFRFIQKSAEWSEGDKMHLNNAILAAEKEWGAESRTAKFLKSLRPQPHQTVEDKSISEEILKYFNAKKDYRSRWYVWVKYASRNPRWKPSEEQMWALDVALENFYDQNDRSALESLRIDLQKLL